MVRMALLVAGVTLDLKVRREIPVHQGDQDKWELGDLQDLLALVDHVEIRV